jgi:uroporphyrinogen decarboxylase
MNSKERVLTALNHEEPDKVPLFIFLTPEVSDTLKEVLFLKSEDPYELDRELGNDLLLCYRGIGDIPGVYKREYEDNSNGEFLDKWGIKYREISYGKDNTKGKYTEIIKHPLANMNDFSSFKSPDPMEEDFLSFETMLNRYKKDYAIIAGVACTILEASWYLRGLENFMMDLKTNRDFAEELMNMVMNYHLEVALKMISMGADIIWVGDDIGMQTGMYISPEDFRKFLKPRYANMFEKFKKANKNIKIAYHSDGYMEPVINDFIEIGLDILNPVQPACMNPYEIKKKYGKSLSFWGTVDVQHVMPFGTTPEVIGEVRERLKTVGPGGGFILCSAHCIQPSARAVDNIFAYYWAANKFGNYPLEK